MSDTYVKRIKRLFDEAIWDGKENAWKIFGCLVVMTDKERRDAFGPNVLTVNNLFLDDWKYSEVIDHLRRWASINIDRSNEIGLYKRLFGGDCV